MLERTWQLHPSELWITVAPRQEQPRVLKRWKLKDPRRKLLSVHRSPKCREVVPAGRRALERMDQHNHGLRIKLLRRQKGGCRSVDKLVADSVVEMIDLQKSVKIVQACQLTGGGV